MQRALDISDIRRVEAKLHWLQSFLPQDSDLGTRDVIGITGRALVLLEYSFCLFAFGTLPQSSKVQISLQERLRSIPLKLLTLSSFVLVS